ncbi:MAG: hypothetical protein KGN84_17960 [Acidobacteriota bacterium]|nr:hypothetical protein [Acidobacteriota bacterium]
MAPGIKLQWCFRQAYFPVGFARRPTDPRPDHAHNHRREIRLMFVRVISGVAAAILSLTPMQAAPAGKGPSGKGKTPVFTGPKNGIKTPGVQIPFANLKADVSLPAANKPVWLFFASGGPGTIYYPDADKVGKIETRGNKQSDGIAGLKKPCGGMVSAFESLWVPTCGDGALQRVDPKTMKITATIPAGSGAEPGNIAASGDSIWMLTDNKATLSRIDPDQNSVVGELRLPPGCEDLIYADSALWIACPAMNRILKINAETNIVDKRIEVSAGPMALVSAQNSIWVLCGKEGKIDRIDPKTDKVTKTIELLASVTQGGMAYGDNYLWVTMSGFPLTRIDVTTESVAQQFWGEGGGAITTSSGAIWLSNLNDRTISRIDPKLVLATLAE